jgi:UDP-3-O-[3-hydroxymyristoyl] N-acetylglucosamine deacetylase/3-hydroxyacyl-[acyl-carrier-protein] dehydratase
VSQQQTLSRPASFSGVGLHSGNRVNMTFLPAPPGTGVRFRRVDLEGRPEIEARVDNVVETNRSTTLAKGNVRVHTVEHVLATFAGFGIDNVIVELDANEPPVGDGSARDYCKLVHSAGIVPLEEKQEAFLVKAPVQLEMGDTVMTLTPGDGFRVTCTSSDKQGRFTQLYTVDVTPKTWEKELAHARTFCFYEEIEYLITNGLIRGGSLENAVIIRDDAVLTTEPLRYPEEFVRHKILDILGDLSLLGRPMRGHLVAVKPSHTANCEFVRHLVAHGRKAVEPVRNFAPSPEASPSGAGAEGRAMATMDIRRVLELLPHRYPFMLVDRVLKIEGNHIVAVKNVTFNEGYFQGHFPGHPIMPGVLQLEAIAQVAGILMILQNESTKQIAYFMAADDVKWRKPVYPGDVLIIEVELTKSRGRIGKAKGVCKVGDEVVSEAGVTFMLRGSAEQPDQT